MIKKKIAKLIRTVTVPPILVFLLLVVLYFFKKTIFAGIWSLPASILFLMAIPLAAYPLASVIPKYSDNRREGQRRLAFILSIFGYTAAVAYGFSAHVNRDLLLIYLTYFISVVILTILNSVFLLRASGHACSVTGPLILMPYFIGWRFVLPCAALLALIIWASLTLKRHTPGELILGSGSALLAFGICLLLLL